ncbi:MAG TPA: M20/M25/M40 family metallo-hydrolase [Chitinophagaceae bacterium]|nr:M20/M25/M40 family metallo-hydrolase [Chitinophagaceae bacterium]
MPLKKLFLLLWITGNMSAGAQHADSVFIRRLADEVLVNSGAYDNLRVLTKTIGGRLAGSPQMVRAELWGAKALRAAGADTVWMQECHVPHWVRGGTDQAKALLPGGARRLDVVALGNSIGSGRPLTGEVIEIADFDDLDRKKEAVRGRIVFYNYKMNPRFIRTFQAYGDAGRYRSQGPARAARLGAKAVIVRSLATGHENHPHTGATVYNDSFPKLPAVAIGLQDADWLSRQAQKGPVRVTLHTHGRFLPDTTGHNVIGELRGTEFPEEIITVGGHLDSWDNGEGAHDDGAGCVQSIEVLRAFRALGYRPKRTIRFVLFANEENGTRGGNKYAEEARRKGERHLFALESDAGGFTPRGFSLSLRDSALRRVQAWGPLLAPYGISSLEFGGGGVDITPLNRLMQTPVSSFIPDSQRYFDLHHARNDVFENVNRRELELGALNMAALVYLVDQYGL